MREVAPGDTSVRAIGLVVAGGGIGDGFVGIDCPALSWHLESDRPDVVQLAYEIQVAEDPDFKRALVTSGQIAGSVPIARPWPAPPLSSRDVRWARVRIWTSESVSGWSGPCRIEAGLLHSADWVARPVTPQSNAGRREPGPVPLFRKAFHIDDDVVSARLYVSALGVGDMWVNDRPVTDALLEPGWTAYQERLLYAVHDVGRLLQRGENMLCAAVGDGWWRGWLTWMGKRNVYGDTTAILAQLEVRFADGTLLRVASDETWRAGYGDAQSADLYNGCRRDLRAEAVGWRTAGFDCSQWEAVETLPLPEGLALRSMPPVRVVDKWSVAPSPTRDGNWMVDTGQNLAGFLRIRARGTAGARLIVRHAEVLDDDGRLFVAPLRRAEATDTYILAGNAELELEPIFTFHGFRYAEIKVEGRVEIINVEVCAISSDLGKAGHFQCSNPMINQLFENVRWSQLSNFVALPTDCPQRDERLGWTGDIQVFAPTACANADANAFLRSWLADLSIEQREDGNLPSTVPNVLGGFEYEYGGVGWGDAATLVPWALYEAYGDQELLSAQFDSMRRWVDHGASRRGNDGTWSRDFHFGDWLDPGAPSDQPHKATTSPFFIATAYLSLSAATVARTATILGDTQAADLYRKLSEDVAAAAWMRWRDHASTTQTGCAVALQFGIVPARERARVATALANLVDAADGRIATGFLGTPLVLPALSDAGQVDAAYKLLLNEKCPGWLYQVRRGATTMWERWDAVQEDGSLHQGAMAFAEDAAMISFNHYAYGAVAEWLYRTVAGIAPDAQDPGYGMICFAPRPGGGITRAEARLQTPYGFSGISWSIDAAKVLIVDLVVAAGAKAYFDPPAGWSGEPRSAFGSGRHHLRLQPIAPEPPTIHEP